MKITITDIFLFPHFFIPDELFLKIKYRMRMGKKLDLKNPTAFSEKVQWLKLYDRNPDYPRMVDKHEVRKYIAETIGEEYLIPSYGVWNSFDEIPFDDLPNEFVLKCTHDSKSVFICKDKSKGIFIHKNNKKLDIKKLRKRINLRFSRNLFWYAREWVYKDIKPRVIAEKLMIEEDGTDLKDYKIYCFNGEPKIISVIYDRFSGAGSKEYFYTPQWERLDMASGSHSKPDVSTSIEKPKQLDKMLELARVLSADKIHVRVDLYSINEKIYFGELTFYGAAGFKSFEPQHWDETLGSWLKLPSIKGGFCE